MNAEHDTIVGTRLPIVFSYRNTFFGNDGTVVEVRAMNGRALCVREADAVWMYGVNPGAMAASGADTESAHAAFRQMFSEVLADLAADAAGFEEFAHAVRAFFDDTNEGYEPEWHDAVRAVRNREVEPGLDLPRVSADAPRSIVVHVKQVTTARDNAADLEPALAA